MATAALAPEVLRIEVMDLDAGEVAVVAQLDREPSSEWVDHLRDIVDSTPGMEEVAVRLDGYWLFFVGFGSAYGSATHNRVARLVASTKETTPTRAPKKPKASKAARAAACADEQTRSSAPLMPALQI